MKLIVSRRATRQIREFSDYLHSRNPAAAIDVREGLQEAFTLLATYPGVGRRIRNHVRRFVLKRFPYLIYYAVDDEVGAVAIITIRHAARLRQD